MGHIPEGKNSKMEMSFSLSWFVCLLKQVFYVFLCVLFCVLRPCKVLAKVVDTIYFCISLFDYLFVRYFSFLFSYNALLEYMRTKEICFEKLMFKKYT